MRFHTTVGSVNRLVTIVGVGVFVLFFAAVSYAFYGQNGKTQTQNPSIAVTENPTASAVSAIYEKDSDGDGLADWEELLWSTDPYNADTDGDGVGDREDVYGSEDVPGAAIVGSGLQPGEAEELVATQVLAREYFAAFMRSLQDGTYEDADKQDKIVEQSVISATKRLGSPPVYDPNEIRVVAATEETRRRYIENIRSIVGSMLNGTESEHKLLYELAQGANTAETLQKLNRTFEAYDAHMSELGSLSVPNDAVEIHTALMRSLTSYLYIVEGLSKAEEDPLRAAVALNTFPTADTILREAFISIRNYMVSTL